MKKIILAGVSALCLLTACGVDKEGTGDKLVEDLEKASGLSFTDDQKDCLKDIVKGLSDDEITDLSESKASAELTEQFQTDVGTCLQDVGTEDVGS